MMNREARHAQAKAFLIALAVIAAGAVAAGCGSRQQATAVLKQPQQPVSAQQATRIYSLHNLITFDAQNCTSGWQLSGAEVGWQFRCVADTATDNSHVVWLYGPRYGVRHSALMWRNNLFPASGNVAVEVRFRYPRMRQPYGQDAFTFYDRTYGGQRLDDQWGNLCTLPQNAGMTWVDPVCADSRVAGYSHGSGNLRDRTVALDYANRNTWSEVQPTQWWTAVYHYEAATGQWQVAVSRGSPPQWQRSWSVPLGAPYHWERTAVTGLSNPVGFKIGHHVHKISPAQAGQWNETMVDYIAVWQWDDAVPTPYISAHARDPAGQYVPVADLTIGCAHPSMPEFWEDWVEARCLACAHLSAAKPDCTFDDAVDPAAGVGLYSDQVLLGITPEPATGWSDFSNRYVWDDWDTGEHTVDFIVATTTPTNTPTPTATPTSTPTPTATPTNTPTPTATSTNTPTPTPTASPTPIPDPPEIEGFRRWLVWYGPDVPLWLVNWARLPAQTLHGSAAPGAQLEITLFSPWDPGARAEHVADCSSGDPKYYTVWAGSDGRWQLGPAESGDYLLGTTCRGRWWAYVRDVAQPDLEAVRASWWVSWFPVHLGR